MLEFYFESTFTLNELRNGPSGAWLDGFATYLHDDGYSWWTGRLFLRAAHHLGHFLTRRRRSIEGLEPSVVEDFRKHLKRCRCPRPKGGIDENTVRGIKCFIRYLQTIEVASKSSNAPLPPLVDGFRLWLEHHRGLSETTIDRYGEAAVEVLREVGKDPSAYDAKRLRSFVLKRAGQRGIGSTRAILSAVRIFLRYLAINGLCQPGLDGAIPGIAGWRLASLPRCLSANEVEQLLTACEATSLMSLRDRAVILLLARLGLRASDVAALRFADIDWEDGSILVKGKSRREARLPLPQEVGDALLAYLEQRPRVLNEPIFLRVVAPIRGLAAPAISQLVMRVMRRAGIKASSYGSHILRHAAATEMLRQGHSLYDIGSVLRHRSVDMSAHYAKVDMELLKHVVQPWPEVLSCS